VECITARVKLSFTDRLFSCRHMEVDRCSLCPSTNHHQRCERTYKTLDNHQRSSQSPSDHHHTIPNHLFHLHGKLSRNLYGTRHNYKARLESCGTNREEGLPHNGEFAICCKENSQIFSSWWVSYDCHEAICSSPKSDHLSQWVCWWLTFDFIQWLPLPVIHLTSRMRKTQFKGEWNTVTLNTL